MWAINVNIKEIDTIRKVINKRFWVKARLWQVSVVIDITKQRQDIYAIAGIKMGKSLVYQSIFVVTSGSVWVISPTIAFIEDHVCFAADHLMHRYIWHVNSVF